MDAKEKATGKKSVQLKISAEPVLDFNCTNCEQQIDAEGQKILGKMNCPHCSAAQVVPGKIGNFQIFKVLGRGAISVVFKALNTRNGQWLALKVSHKLGRKPVEFYDDYLGEAKATTFLNHDNIIKVYDYGFANKYPYIAMEMVPGGTLKELINADVCLNEAMVLNMAHDISSGLQAAYLAGIIHGDLKPANILCHEQREYKIADFGNFNTKGTAKEEASKIFGTPYYIAPEKVQHKMEDHRSDIYSLGATLWHALAGYPPHDGKSVKEVVRAHINNLGARPETRQPHRIRQNYVANQTHDGIEPVSRYQEYRELIDAIEDSQKQFDTQASSGTTGA